jgi:hypothetical protein
MWKRLRPVLKRLWERSRRGSDQRRTVAVRSRFWAEVNEGRLEAEAASRPRPLAPEAKR